MDLSLLGSNLDFRAHLCLVPPSALTNSPIIIYISEQDHNPCFPEVMGSLPMPLSRVPGDTEPSLQRSHNVLAFSNEDSQVQGSEEMHSVETGSIQDLSSAVMLLLD